MHSFFSNEPYSSESFFFFNFPYVPLPSHSPPQGNSALYASAYGHQSLHSLDATVSSIFQAFGIWVISIVFFFGVGVVYCRMMVLNLEKSFDFFKWVCFKICFFQCESLVGLFSIVFYLFP